MARDDERREHPRLDLVAQIELTRGGDVWLVGVRDISGGGLFIELAAGEYARVRAGERLRVVLDLGPDLRLETEAEVVRTEPGGAGGGGGFAIMWVTEDPADVATLARILAYVRELG